MVQLRKASWLGANPSQASFVLQRARRQALTTARWTGQFLWLHLQKGTIWAVDLITTQLRKTTVRAIFKIQKGTQRTVSLVTRSIERLASKVSESLSRSLEKLQLAPGAAWNKFFWWSFAANAVYGISKTVPKEIVRLKMQNQDDQKNR